MGSWTRDDTDNTHLGQHFLRGYKYLNQDGGCDAYILIHGKPRTHEVFRRLNVRGRNVRITSPSHQTTLKSLMRLAHRQDESISPEFDGPRWELMM